MSVTEARSLNLDPAIPVLRKMLSEVDLMKTLKIARDVIDSSALANVSLVSVKSIPYIFHKDNGIVKEFDNGVSCRLRYLEAAVLSLAAVVYNVAFGLIFTALSVATLGQIKWISDQMRKHWIHTVFSVATLAISTVGTFSPELGIKVTLAVGFAVGVALLQWVEGDAVAKICNAFQRNKQELRQAVAQACQTGGINFDQEVSPFLSHLESNLNQRVQTFGEFIEVVSDAVSYFPSNVYPWINPKLVIDQFQEMVSGYGKPELVQT